MWLEFLKFIKTLGDRISEEFQHSLKIVKLFPELDDLLRVIAVVVERLVQGSCALNANITSVRTPEEAPIGSTIASISNDGKFNVRR
jgi:hypothetical protein